jgi:DNA-binding response OmpR family regulator
MFDTYLKNNTNLQTEKKILLVEHDVAAIDCMVSFLRQNKHEVVCAHNGIHALEKFKSEYFDLIIIDKNLPYKDAEALTESIKNAKPNTPIMYITNQPTNEDFSIVKKDFEKQFHQLISKMPEILKRNKDNKSTEIKDFYHLGDFTLDTKNRLLQYKNENPVKLSPKENKLLRILIQNKGNLVNKDILIKKVWYNDELFNLKSIGVYITKLRKLLHKDPSIRIINIYKTGFILTD